MIRPDAEPIAHVSPYKRIEIGARDRKPEPKWEPIDISTVYVMPAPAIWGAVIEAETTAQCLGSFYETVFDRPKGSYRGVYMGVPVFEVPEITGQKQGDV